VPRSCLQLSYLRIPHALNRETRPARTHQATRKPPLPRRFWLRVSRWETSFYFLTQPQDPRCYLSIAPCGGGGLLHPKWDGRCLILFVRREEDGELQKDRRTRRCSYNVRLSSLARIATGWIEPPKCWWLHDAHTGGDLPIPFPRRTCPVCEKLCPCSLVVATCRYTVVQVYCCSSSCLKSIADFVYPTTCFLIILRKHRLHFGRILHGGSPFPWTPRKSFRYSQCTHCGRKIDKLSGACWYDKSRICGDLFQLLDMYVLATVGKQNSPTTPGYFTNLPGTEAPWFCWYTLSETG